MAKINVETIKSSENVIKDLKNWLAVFETEYKVPEEVKNTLNEKFSEIAEKIGSLTCKIKGETFEVDEEQQNEISDLIRDVKNWVEVFKTEFKDSVSEEVKSVIFEKIDELVKKISEIECK